MNASTEDTSSDAYGRGILGFYAFRNAKALSGGTRTAELMLRRLEIVVLLLACSLIAYVANRGESVPVNPSSNSPTLSLNGCVLGMTQEQCRAKLPEWVSLSSFATRDGGTHWSFQPYGYDFGPDKVLRKLGCDRTGTLRYGNSSVKIPTTPDNFKRLLGEPEQVLVYSLVDSGDLEQWYYFRLGLVARVHVSERRTLIGSLTLARLEKPALGGQRVIMPKEAMPDPRY